MDLHADYHAWLECPENLRESYRYSAFKSIWLDHFLPTQSHRVELMQSALKRFRKKMALRIAYRDINQLADVEDTLRELSLLAEFCVQISCNFLTDVWRQRLGIPMNDETQQCARFCILGLGKIGGSELNFWSDIDLIYCYDGEGSCHKQGKITQVTTHEFYHRYCQDLSSFLNHRSEDGTLYNVDLRLRPEGASGPIVRSFTAMESYYWTAGQSWERLAFTRARPIAGDTALGAELLEQLTPFTYPRFPQQSIFQEIASFKQRIEHEVVGADSLARNIKSGPGGIREIEYQVQGLQIAHGGRNPFLQTTSILDALKQLAKYGVLPAVKARFLRKAYLILRHIENRLQMKQEMPVHTLPPPGAELEQLARGLGYPSARVFIALLDALREHVHAYYLEYFAIDETESEIHQWTILFAGKGASESIQQKLDHWFPHEENTTARLLQFALGSQQHLITREQVTLFIEITRYFDDLLPRLATPLTTLERVARFAESYGARKHFFKTAANQQYFRILCLLFDCSPFIHKLLCRHPEIVEALLDESHSREKSCQEIHYEISKLPQDETFPRFLWLYVKAEHIRFAMAELAGRITIDAVEERLTTLADATLTWVLRKINPAGHLAIIALGKYGGRQLGFGSDLDLLILGEQDTLATDQPLLSQLLTIVHYQNGLGPTLNLDFRLRPHGNAGPWITTLHALAVYHERGQAQPWEKQLLTRHRPIAGNPSLIQRFEQFVERLIYQHSINRQEILGIGDMRLKAEQEHSHHQARRALKSGPGGIMDIDFLAQLLQLKYGHCQPQLRVPNTRSVLLAAQDAALIDANNATQLLDHYTFLRRIEFFLRRYTFATNSVIPCNQEIENALAKWMKFDNYSSMHMHMMQCMQFIRKVCAHWLFPDQHPSPQ